MENQEYKLQYSPSFFPVLSVKRYNPLKLKELYNLRLKEETRKQILNQIENHQLQQQRIRTHHLCRKKLKNQSKLMLWSYEFHDQINMVSITAWTFSLSCAFCDTDISSYSNIVNLITLLLPRNSFFPPYCEWIPSNLPRMIISPERI